MSAGQAWQGKLSPREAEVVELLAKGLSNKEIAKELFVEESTVKFHITSARASVGAHGQGRVKLARWWWENVELPALRNGSS